MLITLLNFKIIKFKFKVKNKKNNSKRSEHKKNIKETRLIRLEKQLKSNILKRKKAIKSQNG